MTTKALLTEWFETHQKDQIKARTYHRYQGLISMHTIGSWWGSNDTRIGGIVGAMTTGNNVVIRNSMIACKLDVYNDVTSNYQWHNYRMSGMVPLRVLP